MLNTLKRCSVLSVKKEKKTLVKYKNIMYGSGPVTDLDTLFGGKLKVDLPLREFLTTYGESWEVLGLGLDIVQAAKGISDDEIECIYGVVDMVGGGNDNISFIFATLAHLDSGNGAEALRIPADDDETHVIICYIDEKVVYLEHEREEGKEDEWHLHIRPKKSEWKRAPKVVQIASDGPTRV